MVALQVAVGGELSFIGVAWVSTWKRKCLRKSGPVSRFQNAGQSGHAPGGPFGQPLTAARAAGEVENLRLMRRVWGRSRTRAAGAEKPAQLAAAFPRGPGASWRVVRQVIPGGHRARQAAATTGTVAPSRAGESQQTGLAPADSRGIVRRGRGFPGRALSAAQGLGTEPLEGAG